MSGSIRQLYEAFLTALRAVRALRPPEGQQEVSAKAERLLTALFSGPSIPPGKVSALEVLIRAYEACFWRDVLAPGVLWVYTGPSTPARPLGQQTFPNPSPTLVFHGDRGEADPRAEWFQFGWMDAPPRLLTFFFYGLYAQSGTFPGGWWKRAVNRQDVYGPITIEGDPEKSWRIPTNAYAELQAVPSLAYWVAGWAPAPEFLEEVYLLPRQKVFVDIPPSPPYYAGGRSYSGYKVTYEASVVNQAWYGSPSSPAVVPPTAAQSGIAFSGFRVHITPGGLVVSTSPNPNRGVGWGPVPLTGDAALPALTSPFGDLARLFAEVAHLPDPYVALFGTTQPVLSLEALPPTVPVRRAVTLLQRTAAPAFIARYRWMTRAPSLFAPSGVEAAVAAFVGEATTALALPPEAFLSMPVNAYGAVRSMPFLDVLRQVGRDRRKTLAVLSEEYGRPFSSFKDYLVFALPDFFPTADRPVAVGVWDMYTRRADPLFRAAHSLFQKLANLVFDRSSGALVGVLTYPRRWAEASQRYTAAAQALSAYRPEEEVVPSLAFPQPEISLTSVPSPLGPPGRAYDYTATLRWTPTPGLKTLSVYLRRILTAEDLSLIPSSRHKVAEVPGGDGVATVRLPYKGTPLPERSLAPQACYMVQVIGHFEYPGEGVGETVLVPTPTVRLTTPERRLKLISSAPEVRVWRGTPYQTLTVSPVAGGVLPKVGSVLVFTLAGDEVAIARVVAVSEVTRSSVRVFLNQVFGYPIPLMFTPQEEPSVFRGDGIVLLT